MLAPNLETQTKPARELPQGLSEPGYWRYIAEGALRELAEGRERLAAVDPDLVEVAWPRGEEHRARRRWPTWAMVTDLCLELQACRQHLSRVDEDLVELLATKRYDFYRRIGGTALTEGAFRAKVRHELQAGEHI